VKGSLQCPKCLAGEYQDEEGQVHCKRCPAGFYQNEVGASARQVHSPSPGRDIVSSVLLGPTLTRRLTDSALFVLPELSTTKKVQRAAQRVLAGAWQLLLARRRVLCVRQGPTLERDLLSVPLVLLDTSLISKVRPSVRAAVQEVSHLVQVTCSATCVLLAHLPRLMLRTSAIFARLVLLLMSRDQQAALHVRLVPFLMARVM